LVAVMRRNGALAKDYSERHHVPRWYDDADALINDPEVDAIYIATPPSSHKQYVIMSAAAGKPVYVEKPMALNFGECQEMVATCRSAGVPLLVAYYRRALPRFLKIKELVSSGAIGDVRFVNVTFYQPTASEDLDPENLPWRVIPEIAGGGRFLDLASHTLDFLDFALGPIVEVLGQSSNQTGKYPAEDIVTSTFKFASGVHGTGTWCFSSYDKCDVTEIVGSSGKISFSTFDAAPVRLATAEGVSEYAFDYPQHIAQPLIQTVVNELIGLEKCPSTGESAARTSWVMDRMLNH
jgi:predicted dehydrogenase